MRSGKWKNPQVNKLTKRVEVWGMVDTENAIGSIEKRPAKIKTIWAEIIPTTGSMGDRVGTEFAKMTHKVRVRYSAGRDITNTHFLKYAGRRYDVLYMLNPFEKNEIIELFTSEVME